MTIPNIIMGSQKQAHMWEWAESKIAAPIYVLAFYMAILSPENKIASI